MICKVENCKRDAVYKGLLLCQMHYFRKMRNGTFERKPKKEKYLSSNGYYSLVRKNHPLSGSGGLIKEHRYIYFEKINKNPSNCDMCGKGITWENLHIDHIDNNRANNNTDNLRALCCACNCHRARPLTSGCKYTFTINGLSMSARAWSRRADVKLSGAQIIKRKKDYGWSDFDCVYKDRMTHKLTKTKNIAGEYDSLRLEANL